MKVEFLRRYGRYQKGDITDISLKEDEREYLINTKTIRILEDEVLEIVVEEDDLPEVTVDVEVSETNQRKKR